MVLAGAALILGRERGNVAVQSPKQAAHIQCKAVTLSIHPQELFSMENLRYVPFPPQQELVSRWAPMLEDGSLAISRTYRLPVGCRYNCARLVWRWELGSYRDGSLFYRMRPRVAASMRTHLCSGAKSSRTGCSVLTTTLLLSLSSLSEWSESVRVGRVESVQPITGRAGQVQPDLSDNVNSGPVVGL